MEKKILLDKIRSWMKENALYDVTVSPICSDDGIMMVKRSDTEAQGDWSQKDWDDDVIQDFKEEFIDFDELNNLLDLLEKEE